MALKVMDEQWVFSEEHRAAMAKHQLFVEERRISIDKMKGHECLLEGR
jgi:hypothetical protein